MFADCPAEVKVVVDDEKSLKAKVIFSEFICRHSKQDKRARPQRADKQRLLYDKLKNTLPRAEYLQQLEGLSESVFESGCRDEAPSPGVLKSISCRERQKERKHRDDFKSLQKMLEERTEDPAEVLQKVILEPKGVMLWSKRSIDIFHHRCKEDIVYLDATGSILKKSRSSSRPFYVYELVVRNPKKGSSPFPVATFLTCDHTTSSILYFLSAFQTEHRRQFGHRDVTPVMIICDGSMVLMQAISMVFCKTNLNALIRSYWKIITGSGTEEDFSHPILHRCLSHIMKNAKTLCKRQ